MGWPKTKKLGEDIVELALGDPCQTISKSREQTRRRSSAMKEWTVRTPGVDEDLSGHGFAFHNSIFISVGHLRSRQKARRNFVHRLRLEDGQEFVTL